MRSEARAIGALAVALVLMPACFLWHEAPAEKRPTRRSTRELPVADVGHVDANVDANVDAFVPDRDAGQAGEDDADPDQDGLSSADERALGTDPQSNDSDADGFDDGVEIGNITAPSDADGDSRWDALESAYADNDSNGRSDQLQRSVGWEVQLGRFRPCVVPNDGSSSATFEVRINGARELGRVAVAREAMIASERDATDILFLDDRPVGFTEVELFDDGTHGDRVAGDGLFAREGFVVRGAIRRDNQTRDQVLLNTIIVGEGERREVRDLRSPSAKTPVLQRSFALGVLEAGASARPEILGPGVYGSKHVVNIVDPTLATVARRALLNPSTDTSALAHAALRRSGQDYDFVVVLTPEVVFTSYIGRSFRASNDASGLGLPLQAPEPKWGSAGKLKSVLLINLGPDTSITHELMHHWGVYWSDSLGFDYDADHWGWAGAAGVLGGFDPATLTKHDDGTLSLELFTFEGHFGTTRPLANVELYLMGLVDASEVAPIPMLRNFRVQRREGSVITGTGDIRTLTMQDIIAVEGERKPSPKNSQKAFDALFVVFSDQPLIDAELGFFESLSAQYESPRAQGWLSFAEATGDRARLRTTLGDAFTRGE